MASTLTVNRDRLWASIMEIGELGALDAGGSNRQTLTDEDRAARDLLVRWGREAGCEIAIDPLGNIFLIRKGSSPAAPVVLTGSHLDTQPHAGLFDGIYGVMAGLEVIRMLNDAGVTTLASVVAVNWTNEEGVRFAPGLTGSRGFAGIMDEAACLDLIGEGGLRFGDELARIGYAGTLASKELPVACYLEAHIEQGPCLEELGKTIGIVSGVAGVRWFEICVEGMDSHAGTTPMQTRKDSFMAAARFSLEMRSVAVAIDPAVRFTVGRISVEPGSPNTVPGLARFTIDLRHERESILDRIETEMNRCARSIEQLERVSISVERTMIVPPVSFDSSLIDLLVACSEESNLRHEKLVSGAMHDASNLARIVPSAMIFVPCRGGVSHNQAEWAEPSHIAGGCTVLAKAIVALAS